MAATRSAQSHAAAGLRRAWHRHVAPVDRATSRPPPAPLLKTHHAGLPAESARRSISVSASPSIFPHGARAGDLGDHAGDRPGRSLSIITGASRGLGAQIAQQLAQLADPSLGHAARCPGGHDLLLLARDPARCRAFCQRLQQQVAQRGPPVRVVGRAIDLGDMREVERALPLLTRSQQQVRATRCFRVRSCALAQAGPALG